MPNTVTIEIRVDERRLGAIDRVELGHLFCDQAMAQWRAKVTPQGVSFRL